MDEWTDRCREGCIDEWKDGTMKGGINSCIYEFKHGSMEQWRGKSIEGSIGRGMGEKVMKIMRVVR